MVIQQPRRYEQLLEELEGVAESIFRNPRFQSIFC